MSALKDFLFGKARGKSEKDYEIELHNQPDLYDEWRRYYYRVVPSELPLLKRLFGSDNYVGWSSLYRYEPEAVYDNYRVSVYNKEQYYELVHNLHTLGDVRRFLDEQDVLIKKKKDSLKAAHKMWPDY